MTNHFLSPAYMQRKEQIFKQTNICPHELSKSILKTSFTSYGIIRIIFLRCWIIFLSSIFVIVRYYDWRA